MMPATGRGAALHVGGLLFVLRELGASEVVNVSSQCISVCGQAGLWAVLAELDPTGIVCFPQTSLVNDN